MFRHFAFVVFFLHTGGVIRKEFLGTLVILSSRQKPSNPYDTFLHLSQAAHALITLHKKTFIIKVTLP